MHTVWISPRHIYDLQQAKQVTNKSRVVIPTRYRWV